MAKRTDPQPPTGSKHFILEWMEVRGLDDWYKLGDKMGTSYANARRWALGERGLDLQKLKMFADALDVDVPDLFRSPLDAPPGPLLGGLSDAAKADVLSYIKFKRVEKAGD